MAKTCATCHAENRDDAQFCRACGTSFVATPTPPDDSTTTGLVCADCGFENQPGIRYCAKCGANLVSPSARARNGTEPAAASATRATPRGPIIPADNAAPVPDVPDPSVAIAVERVRPSPVPAAGIGFGAPPQPVAPRRTGLWAG